MADPFEVRMRFTSQLQHLNATTTSALKAANYAVKYAEFSDDLHSCILEQLEQRHNMNNRANIMYFLPALCDAAQANTSAGSSAAATYPRMMERDILRIIDLVAPDDGSGAANVKVVRHVLKTLQAKQFLQPQTVRELEECIAGRDSSHNGVASSPPAAASALLTADGTGGGTGGSGGGTGGTSADLRDIDGTASGARSTPLSSVPGGGSAAVRDPFALTGVRLDKRQIEQRIEEDRERHKRAREGIWAVPQQSVANGGSLAEDAEIEKMWEEVSDVGDDDYSRAKEEAEDRNTCFAFEEV